MEELIRYSKIEEKNKREIVLLRGSGCKWKKCSFCDYHTDACLDEDENYKLNSSVLSHVSGEYGKLEVINSGSFSDLDEKSINEIIKVSLDKNINEIHFECHFLERKNIPEFRKRFKKHGIDLKIKIGIETFDTDFRQNVFHKGMPETDLEELSKYFNECCLLFGIKGQTEESMRYDIDTGLKYFERICVNIMVPNTTDMKPDHDVIRTFAEKIYPDIKDNKRADILFDNTDYGVGGAKEDF